MRFELRDPYVVVHDKRPGNHATLFVNGVRALFRGDLSHFDNRRSEYAWAFEGAVKDDDELVFATDDRQLAGRVRGNTVEAAAGVEVRRAAGKPTAVAGALEPLRPTQLTVKR